MIETALPGSPVPWDHQRHHGGVDTINGKMLLLAADRKQIAANETVTDEAAS